MSILSLSSRIMKHILLGLVYSLRRRHYDPLTRWKALINGTVSLPNKTKLIFGLFVLISVFHFWTDDSKKPLALFNFVTDKLILPDRTPTLCSWIRASYYKSHRENQQDATV